MNPIDADANVFKSCWNKFKNRYFCKISFSVCYYNFWIYKFYLQCSDQLEISLPETSIFAKSLTLDDIEGVFKESNIFTMASGNTGDVLKFFLYAEEVGLL